MPQTPPMNRHITVRAVHLISASVGGIGPVPDLLRLFSHLEIKSISLTINHERVCSFFSIRHWNFFSRKREKIGKQQHGLKRLKMSF